MRLIWLWELVPKARRGTENSSHPTSDASCDIGKRRRRLSREEATDSEVEEGSGSEGVDEGEQDLEPWKDWLQRTTADVEMAMQKLNMDDWVTIARQRQCSWACTVVHHAAERWTARILHWQPEEGYRRVGHPRQRWLDPIKRFAQNWSCATPADAWLYLLANKEEADKTLQEYSGFCNKAAG